MTHKDRKSMDEIVRKLHFEPMKKTHEASFSSMRKGMKDIKNDGNQKDDRFRDKRAWNARVAVIAAVAILFLLLINVDFLPTAGDNNEEQNQEETVNHAGVNNDKNNGNDQDSNEDQNGGAEESTADRPEMKSITTYPEGGERTREYQLLHEEVLPFTTYVREEWQINVEEDTDPFMVRLTPYEDDYDFGQMIIHVSRDNANLDLFLEEMIDQGTEYEEVHTYESQDGTPFHDWLIEGYRFVDYESDTTGYSYLFEAEGYVFWVHSEHRLEFQEGWFDDDIFSREWEWN